MANENHLPDDDAVTDPFEAELVAYLDGEADEETTRKVEARLAKDPTARTRAAELKKSFDLLDYLPKSEPSPNFTTRTLDKLPTSKPTEKTDSQPASKPNRVKAVRFSDDAVSTSLPLPLDSDSDAVKPARSPVHSRSLLWLAGLAVAVFAFASVGFFASALVRPHLLPHSTEKEKLPDEAKVEAGPRVIENLPLYTGADDIGFVNELAKPDLFADDPAVVVDPTLKIPSGNAEKPNAQELESLQKSFSTMPTARQKELVELDKNLHAKEPKERDRLLRVLEAYSAWLGRLPEADRRSVMSAVDSEARLKAVYAIRDKQWLESLPPAVRAKPELILQWKEEEADRRDRWVLLRRHIEKFGANGSPWPFDTERGRNEVIEFAARTFKTEDIRKCRLSLVDLGEYNRTLRAAKADDTWVWYGLVVYELNKLHPYLPEPDDAKLMISDINDLPEPYQSRVNPKKGPPFGGRPRLNSMGKWPEFPLEVQKEVPFGKGFNNPPPLGPSRLREFKPAVRKFATDELFPKMTHDEKRDLQRVEGKWPEYSQQLMHFAHKYDLSVPGASLPGPPKRWEATYGLRAK